MGREDSDDKYVDARIFLCQSKKDRIVNLSRTPIITKIRNALSKTPLYKPIRLLYNKVLLFNAKRTVTLADLSVTFWIPTFKMLDDLETLAEKKLILSFLKSLRTGDTVWDVGANIGIYALFAAKAVGMQGHVVAIEPEPRTRALLERNIILNNLHNVTVLDCALGKENTIRMLYSSATPNPGSHSLAQRTDYRVKRKGISVPTIKGDTLIQQKKVYAPHILKIDVEGAEMDVLTGMISVFQEHTIRMMVIEIHPNVLPLFGASVNDVETLIRSLGFSSIARFDRGTEYHLICNRN